MNAAVPLVIGLQDEGFRVLHATDDHWALKLARAAQPDLVLLDVGLPRMDGLAGCRTLRRTSTVPIILLTTRGQERERVRGLELGADGYLVKPFGSRELVARVRAVLRRRELNGGNGSPPRDRIVVGEIVLDRAARQVWRAGRAIRLRREFDLLGALMENAGTSAQPTPTPGPSPVGQILFTSGTSWDQPHDIYVMNEDGTNVRRLTHGPGSSVDARFSPDGSKIVFASDRAGDWYIYTMNADGTNVQQLAPAGDRAAPDWSPDGRFIAYTCPPRGICVMKADGTNIQQLTSTYDGWPRWSHDDNRIAFSSWWGDGDWEIYVMSADGSNQTNLTRSPGTSEVGW